MLISSQNRNYSKMQILGLVMLRVMIGWYFLYEGLVKLLTPHWTSYAYLMDSKGVVASFFIMIAKNSSLLSSVDFINIYGLILIGLSLILGCFNRIGNMSAIILLALYYLSHPPLIGVTYLLSGEGSGLWVDKNMIILFAIVVLMVFPTSKIIGLDRLIFNSGAIRRKS